MKKLVKICYTLILVIFLLTQSSVIKAIGTYKIVASINNPRLEVPLKVKKMLFDALNAQILLSQRFRLVSKEVVSSYVKSIKSKKVSLDNETLKHLIQNYDIDALFILDSALLNDGRIVVALRLVDARNGRTVAFENELLTLSEDKGKLKYDVELMVKDLYYRILNLLPYQASVTSVNGKFITIDAGSTLRLKKGDFLKLVRIEDAIRSPSMGELMDVQKIELGTVKLVDLKDEVSLGVVISLDEGKKIQVGDKVLLHGLDFQKYFDKKITREKLKRDLSSPKDLSNVERRGDFLPKSQPKPKEREYIQKKKDKFPSEETGSHAKIAPSREHPIGISRVDSRITAEKEVSYPTSSRKINIGASVGPFLYFFQIKSSKYKAVISSPYAFLDFFKINGYYDILPNVRIGADYSYGKSSVKLEKKNPSVSTDVSVGYQSMGIWGESIFNLDLFGGGRGLEIVPKVGVFLESVESKAKSSESVHINNAKQVSSRELMSLDIGCGIQIPLYVRLFAGLDDLGIIAAINKKVLWNATDKLYGDFSSDGSSYSKYYLGVLSKYKSVLDLKVGAEWTIYDYLFPGNTQLNMTNVSIYEQMVLIHLGISYSF